MLRASSSLRPLFSVVNSAVVVGASSGMDIDGCDLDTQAMDVDASTASQSDFDLFSYSNTISYSHLGQLRTVRLVSFIEDLIELVIPPN